MDRLHFAGIVIHMVGLRVIQSQESFEMMDAFSRLLFRFPDSEIAQRAGSATRSDLPLHLTLDVGRERPGEA